MRRIRTVKPELFGHEELFDLEAETNLPVRLAFIALFTCCDREGRFKWRERTLKRECLPYDDVDFSRVLDALTSRGFLRKYQVNNEEFGFIPTWHDHQHINPKEKQSQIPEPIENKEESNATLTRERRDDDAPLRKGKERKGKEQGDARDVFDVRVLEAAGLQMVHSIGDLYLIGEWLNAGWTEDQIIEQVAAVRARRTARASPPKSLRYYHVAFSDGPPKQQTREELYADL